MSDDANRLYSVTLEHDPERNPPCYYVPEQAYEMEEGKYLEVNLGNSFPDVVEGYEDRSTWITWENGTVTKSNPKYSVIESVHIYANDNGSPGALIGSASRLFKSWDPVYGLQLGRWWDTEVMDGGKKIYKLSLLSSNDRVCRIWDEDVPAEGGPDDIYHFGLQVSMGGVIYGSDPEMHNKGGGGRRRRLVQGLMGRLGGSS